MATANPKLYEAFEEEAKDVNLEELMQQMLGAFNEEKGYEPTPADEIRIRKMMLARKYLEKEADHLTLLKAAIVEDWDQKIKKKLDDAKSIDEFIERYLKDVNKGKKLSLDVGTATLRRSAPKAKVIDQDKARAFLQEHNQLEAYLKPGVLDVSLLQRSYMNQFEKLVEDQTKARITAEVEQSEKGKITKKREGEIKLEVEQFIADQYFTSLPDFFEYIPESKSISITMK